MLLECMLAPVGKAKGFWWPDGRYNSCLACQRDEPGPVLADTPGTCGLPSVTTGARKDTVVTAVLAVAALCTLLVKTGWLIWIPVLLALVVVGYLATANRG